jgi:hypothetical protein
MFSTVQDLGKVFNLPQCPVPPYASVHDVASFLKQWLREAPAPLIPPSILNSTYRPQDNDAIIEVLRALPPINRNTLAPIVGVVSCVLSNTALNQMTPANITTCLSSSFTQNDNGLSAPFYLVDFMTRAGVLLNETKDGFVLE